MSTEQKVIALRDEFEDHAQYMALEGREVDLNWQTWKAAHAKYAPRWLPIDKAPKDRTIILIGFALGVGNLRQDDRRVFEGRWHAEQSCFTSVNGFLLLDRATHYMPIPDAPEVG